MNKNNNKGFALILSIVLLLVMSLMGGSLVVISSNDHRGNNYTDVSQQTFYVAETGLLEAEKYLVNSFLGLAKREISDEGEESTSTDATKKGIPPQNSNTADQTTVCYKSFKNLINLTNVVVHDQNGSFLNIVYPALVESEHSDPTAEDDKEVDYLDKFKYEYIIENIGDADFNESGSSISSRSLDVINAGTAYRIFACGIYVDGGNNTVIPLESLIVLPG